MLSKLTHVRKVEFDREILEYRGVTWNKEGFCEGEHCGTLPRDEPRP